MLRDSLIAALRTGIAALIGMVVAWLFSRGVVLDREVQASLTTALFVLGTAAYNLLVIVLERKVHPMFGVLLGVPKSPHYGTIGTQTPPPVEPAIGQPPVDPSLAEASPNDLPAEPPLSIEDVYGDPVGDEGDIDDPVGGRDTRL